jgi:hypothetical protein
MTFTNTPTAVSIFPKGKSNTQISSNQVQNGSGLVSLGKFMDTNDTLDHLTQDENSSSGSTQSSKEHCVNDEKYDNTALKKHSTLTGKLPTSLKKASESDATPIRNSTNIGHTNLSVSTLHSGHTGTPPMITPQSKTKNSSSNITSGKNNNGKIYSSPFLTEEFRPSMEDVKLTPELELLRPLILSQHEAFTEPIKELGHINLILTKIIEQKKASFNLLKNHNKIPRSLRIKCELTTSESYTDNEDFLLAKEELQNIVADFTKKGTKVITDWAEKNIKLLITDRCVSLLTKTIQILDDLVSFFQEVIGTPNFLSLPSPKCINLFLLKLYFSNEYIEIDELTNYLGLPRDEILTIGAKIITQNDSDDDVNSMLRAVKLSDINPDNEVHDLFFSETLTCFHQIFCITTIDIWEAHKERDKLSTAALNLKAKRKSTEITNITASTANAIAKAQESVFKNQSKYLNSTLRITNLEKSFKRQEQKTNEALNTLYKNNSSQPKNLKGSSITGSGTSPERKTLPKNVKNKNKNQTKKKNLNHQRIIDLSEEESQESDPSALQCNHPSLNQMAGLKRQKSQRYLTPNEAKEHGKAVHWNEAELTSLNPRLSESVPPHIQQMPMLYTHTGTTMGPPFFPPAPIPYHPGPLTHMPYTHQTQSQFQPYNPGYPIHWQPPQWSIPQDSSLTNLNANKKVSAKGNQFWTQHS